MAKEKKYLVTASELNIREGPGINYKSLDIVKNGEKILSLDTEGWLPILLEDDTLGWASSRFLKEAPAEKPKPAGPIPSAPGGEPPWIVWAKNELGEKELPGAGDNPEIIKWFELTTLPKDMWHDATPWCAVFVNAGFFLNGVEGLRSARAKDWLEFGEPVDPPETGDVVVFQWDDGGHHVAYFLEQDDDRVRVIGGNQSNAVTIETFLSRHVAGFRRPPAPTIQAAPKAVPSAENDFSTKEGTKGEDQLAWGKKVSGEFRQRVREIAASLKTDPDYLMACMAFETGETFSPSERNAAGSGATGLIQFMPSTAQALGTTTEELASMTAVEQLEFVEKYFKQSSGKLSSLDDVYMAILWPVAVGKPRDFVLFDKNDPDHPKRYIQNAGLDFNQDGFVTKAEAADRVRKTLEKGKLPEFASA